MQPLELVLYPDPILDKVCRDVTVFDDDLKAIVKDMFRVMYESKGLGLAATQVGLDINIAVLNFSEQKGGDELVVVNPELELSDNIITSNEGCLSFPGIRVNIPRREKLKIKAFDTDGAQFDLDFDGLAARALQHECDHLEGITMIKRMRPAARLLIKKQLRDLEKQYKKKIKQSR